MLLTSFNFPFSGLASIIAGLFLLMLGAGIIGRRFENAEAAEMLLKRKKRNLILGAILFLAGIAIMVRYYYGI